MTFVHKASFPVMKAALAALMLTLSAPVSADTVDALLVHADFEQTAKSYASYAVHLAEVIPEFPQEYLAPWEASAEIAYAPDRVREVMREIYLTTLSPETIVDIVDYLDSDVGADVLAATRAQARQPRHENESGMEILATFIEQQPDRYALYQELYAAQFPDYSLASLSDVLIVLLTPIIGAGPAVEYAAIAMPVINESTEPGLLFNMVMTYQDLSDAQMRSHIAFAQSETGRAYFEAEQQIINAVFENSIDTLTEEFARRADQINK